MHKTLHPSDDKDRLFVSRKGEGRGPGTSEDCVDTSIRHLDDYIKKELRKTDYGDQKQHNDQN